MMTMRDARGTDEMTFGEWLERTLLLQRASYGEDPPAKRGKARADYIIWNVLAATDELHEFLRCTRWKPWAKDQGAVPDRDAAVEELVDVLHFVANLLVTLGVDGEELTERYLNKMVINSERQRVPGGYDAAVGS